jgi:lipopolysaccharide assembly outer membrane protein LptD (OstA)
LPLSTIRLLSPCLLVSLFPCLLSPASAQKQKLPTPPRVGEITIEKFRELLYQPDTNYFKSPGPVTITIIDADTGEKTVLTADDAEGQPNGDIIVKGALKLVRTEGYLSGRGLTYRGAEQTGEVSDAESRVANTTLRGKKIELMRDEKGRQVLRATGAYFTTCIEQTPHYHITAREIRVLTSSRKVTAKDLGFWVGKTKLFSLPSFTRSFNRTSESPIPLPGYSNEDFLHIRFANSVIEEPKTLFT